MNLALKLMLALSLLIDSHNVAAEAEACIEINPPPTACSLNQLDNGAVADANAVMENFNTLGSAIDKRPPSVCTDGQMTRSSEGEWICADMPSSSPYTWQYKGSITQLSTQIDNGTFHLVNGGANPSLQFSARNSRNEVVFGLFYFMEPRTNCWISLSSSTGNLAELTLTAVTQLLTDSWDLIIDSDPMNSLTGLTTDAIYRLEVIGCS